jgi:hypothetical protein
MSIKKKGDVVGPKKTQIATFGELFKKLVISRFCWIMTVFYAAGCPGWLWKLFISGGDYFDRESSWEVQKKKLKGRNLSQSVTIMNFFFGLTK